MRCLFPVKQRMHRKHCSVQLAMPAVQRGHKCPCGQGGCMAWGGLAGHGAANRDFQNDKVVPNLQF